jgi:type III secretion protein V
VPLLLELDQAHIGTINSKVLAVEAENMLQNLTLRMGVALPRLEIHTRPFVKQMAGANGWQLSIYETPVANGVFSTKDTTHNLLEAVRNAMRRNLSLFIGTQETANVINYITHDIPELAKELGRAMPVPRVADILRRLVEEEISLRNMRDLIEGLTDAAQNERDSFALTELTRISLKRHICHNHAENGKLRAILLDQEMEQCLRQGISDEGGTPRLALDPVLARAVIDQIASRTQSMSCSVLVTTVDIRRHLRKLIEQDLFDVAVLSFHELTSQLQLDVVGYLNFPIMDPPMLQAAE